MINHKLGFLRICNTCGQLCNAKLVRHPSYKQHLIYWECACCRGNMKLSRGHWESHEVLQTNGYNFLDLPIGVAYGGVSA